MISINDRRRQSPQMFPAALTNLKETKLFCVLLPVQIACGVFRESWNVFFKLFTLCCLRSRDGLWTDIGKKKKHMLWIRLRFYSTRMKYLYADLWKANFGSVYLRSGCFALLKTVGEAQPSIPTVLELVNLARCLYFAANAEVSSLKKIKPRRNQ